ncbi:hypothetical protein Golomagni_03060 [Golovinomyces magnicellulatus]|nr:hypothetical protein Golomagni_03060 [Golovinomyces magnicellulatus]
MSTQIDHHNSKLKRKNSSSSEGTKQKKQKKENVTSKTITDNFVTESIPTVENIQGKNETVDETKSKNAPTKTRMSYEKKERLALSGRAAYCRLPIYITKNRAAGFTALRNHIEHLLLKGLEVIDTSGPFFFALVFDNADHLERGINELAKTSFKWNGTNVKVVARRFRNSRTQSNSVWKISSEPLLTGPNMVNLITNHIQNLDPQLKSKFILRKLMKGKYHNGEWAVKFLGQAPAKFVKEMKMGNEKLYVTREPYFSCRFCRDSSHNMFECNVKTHVKLGPDAWEGTVGVSEVEKNVDEEAAEDSDEEATEDSDDTENSST